MFKLKEDILWKTSLSTAWKAPIREFCWTNFRGSKMFRFCGTNFRGQAIICIFRKNAKICSTIICSAKISTRENVYP